MAPHADPPMAHLAAECSIVRAHIVPDPGVSVSRAARWRPGEQAVLRGACILLLLVCRALQVSYAQA